MTADDFRNLALDLPGAIEASHCGHPDFRVRGKIFATLGPGEAWGMVKLTPEEQARVVHAEPEIFQPIDGAWGRQGCTRVCLEAARTAAVLPALTAAWRNTAARASGRGRKKRA